jgi:hypothetical protein
VFEIPVWHLSARLIDMVPWRVALVLAAAGTAWFLVNGERDLSVRRHAFEARAFELLRQGLVAGSPLACLGVDSGDTVEAACESAIFATPETTAASVLLVSAQLALLAEGTAMMPGDPGYEAMITGLRRRLENDRFGLVARALAMRDGCTPNACSTFALFHNVDRLRDNLAEQRYESYVSRHAARWPSTGSLPAAETSAPVASAPTVKQPAPMAAFPVSPEKFNAPVPASASEEAISAQASVPPNSLKRPGPDVFFPSAASIPPISIMNPEPNAANPAAAKVPPASQRRRKEQSSVQ